MVFPQFAHELTWKIRLKRSMHHFSQRSYCNSAHHRCLHFERPLSLKVVQEEEFFGMISVSSSLTRPSVKRGQPLLHLFFYLSKFNGRWHPKCCITVLLSFILVRHIVSSSSSVLLTSLPLSLHFLSSLLLSKFLCHCLGHLQPLLRDNHLLL